MKISVVIPAVNDHAELLETVKSIRETAGEFCEIVVVDDCSATAVALPPEFNVRVYRNFYRIGSGASRHVGAEIATGDHMVMTDSHVRFEPMWLEHVLDGIEQFPHSVLCGVCKGFTPKVPPFGVPAGTYYGANMQFIGQAPGDQRHAQILEGVWAGDREDLSEISCPMGACYVVPRVRFLQLGGMNHFRTWGVEEQLLSLKFYLSGSNVRLLKKFQIWHRFRDGEALPFHNALATVLYNKLFVIYTIFPPEMAKRTIAELPKCADLNTAQDEIRKDWRLIEAERAHNRNIFVNSVEWLRDKFDIPML